MHSRLRAYVYPSAGLQVRVPAGNLVGKEGDAMLHMMRNLEIERLTLAAMSLGIARRSIEVCAPPPSPARATAFCLWWRAQSRHACLCVAVCALVRGANHIRMKPNQSNQINFGPRR